MKILKPFFVSIICMACVTIGLQAQNVGIGTLTPSEKLQVEGGNIKLGMFVWNPDRTHMLKFGDGEYVHVAEIGDDSLQIQANHINLRSLGGNTKLTVNGAIKMADGTQGTGRLLTSSADGTASWQASASANTGFAVSRSSSFQLLSPSASYQKISFPIETFNDGALWNMANHEYTVPSTGVYNFDARVFMTPSAYTGTKNFIIAICVNNIPAQRIIIGTTYNLIANQRGQYPVSGLVKCNVNDKVSVQLYSDSGADVYVNGDATAFSGYRVY